jgi:dipicolinate synthase subunit A
MKSIGVIAGDLRQYYIYNHLKSQNYNAEYIYELSDKDIYILPVPFTKDNISVNCMLKQPMSILDFIRNMSKKSTLYSGYFTKDSKELLNNNQIKYVDLMENPYIVSENSYLTAEGLLSKVIQSVPFSLKNENIFLIGYGNCGQKIVDLFNTICKSIYIYDIDSSKYSLNKYKNVFYISYSDIPNTLNKCSLIINTSPDFIMNKNRYIYTKKESFIFDITSNPNSFNTDELKTYHINYFTCPGIPGNCSPKTAGDILSDYIIKQLEGK